MSKWETLDTEALLGQRDDLREQTTSANAGAFVLPLGRPLRAAFPGGGQMGDLPDDLPEGYLELLGFKRSPRR
jgi:hypothetical protein